MREIARVLQLEDVLDRRPGQLAEGEKQRVAVGRSIIRDAVCFLFDEPLSRLDVQLRETMRGQIKEVLEGLNKATVIVTHDQLEALTMADRIAVMRAGRIEQIASPHAIFARPANLFVAGFIGTPQMNLIEATVDRLSAERRPLHAAAASRSACRSSAPTARLAPGAEVTLGIRPRAFELAAEPDATTLSATVDMVEPMGAETLLHLLADGRDLRAVVGRRVRVPVGSTVHAHLRPSQTHIFDEQGRRLAVRRPAASGCRHERSLAHAPGHVGRDRAHHRVRDHRAVRAGAGADLPAVLAHPLRHRRRPRGAGRPRLQPDPPLPPRRAAALAADGRPDRARRC